MARSAGWPGATGKATVTSSGNFGTTSEAGKRMPLRGGVYAPATALAPFNSPGKNAPPVIWLSPKGSPVQAPVKGEATLTPEQAQQFSAGEWYINVHTQDHQSGEIRGQVMPPKS
jgi:hypothetical protein